MLCPSGRLHIGFGGLFDDTANCAQNGRDAASLYRTDAGWHDGLAGDGLVGRVCEPVLLVVGPDDQSVRAFRGRIPGVNGVTDFYRLAGGVLMDDTTGSEWNFQGCATSGKSKGLCLEAIPMLKDYWFDWRNYHPQTSVYGKE